MKTSVLTSIIFCLAIFSAPALSDTIYVDDTAPGTNDGSSWFDAYTDLQTALSAEPPMTAAAGDEIHVAQGTYTPGTERTDAFQLEQGDILLGGYAGYGCPDPDARDIELYKTTLSGDIGTPIDNSDNSYHVVTMIAPIGPAVSGTDYTAENGTDTLLDGFTITEGNADSMMDIEYLGGGMYLFDSDPTVANCTFINNTAIWGGGMFNEGDRSPTITDCTFEANKADYGAGMLNYENCSPAITDCIFRANEAVYSGGGIYNNSDAVIITSSTFEANKAYYGAGMMNSGYCSPTVIDCVFTENSAMYDGGGIENYNYSNPIIMNCTFKANRAPIGGGIMNYEYCSPTVTSCIFKGNVAEYDGAGMYNYYYSSPTVTNCSFKANKADVCAGMLNNEYCDPVVTNCTFAANTANFGTGMLNYVACNPVVTNCIFWSNIYTQIENAFDSYPVVTYCDIQGGHPGESNIDADPLFVDTTSPDPNEWNLHLRPSSPCIDTGDNDAVPLGIKTDLDGNDRIVDGDENGVPTVDMGAYEWSHFIYVDDNAPGKNDGSTWYNAYNDLQSALAIAAPRNHIYVAQGTYRPGLDRIDSFRMKNGVEIYGGFAGFPYEDPNTRDVQIYQSVLSGDIGIPGDNSDNSYHVFYHPAGTNLNSTAVLDGFTITAGNADGSYPESAGGGMYNDSSSPAVNNCTFIDNVSLHYGGGMWNHNSSGPVLANCTFANNSTQYGGGMSNWTSSPALDNCTFADNTAEYGGGIYNYDNSIPTVTDCSFTGNTATERGAGIFNYKYSAPNVINCIFSANTAATGGGISNYYSSSPTVINCLLADNTADHGAGMWNSYHSSPTVTNCTFAYNNAYDGGGMSNNYYSKPIVTNCILWANSDRQISNNRECRPVVTYCDVQGGYLGAANINGDPKFIDPVAGDFRIMLDSPCTDVGNDSAIPLGMTTDLAGAPRFLDGDNNGSAIVDIGAYEAFSGTDPLILPSQKEVYFTADEGGPDPDNQILTVTNLGGGILNWTMIETCDWLTADPMAGTSATGEGDDVTLSVDVSALSAGLYSCELTISDPLATNDPQVVTVILDIGGALVVPDQFPTIQAAIDAAVEGDLIVVAPGIYVENINFLGKNITLTAIDPAYPSLTVIDGNASGPVVTFEGMETGACELIGFTITNGRSSGSGQAGGINGAGASPTISHCIISSNYATTSGAGMAGCNGLIFNCVIRDNSIFYGCGGLYQCSGAITNCTIVNNTAAYIGAGMGYCQGTITNCIVWGNKPYAGQQSFNSSVPTYSCLQGWIGGGIGNINDDPLFATGPLGDYYLSQIPSGQEEDSPCVDAGSDTAVNIGMDTSTTRTDEFWDTGAVDMGYHYAADYGFGGA